MSATDAVALWVDGWHPLSSPEGPLAALRHALVAGIGALPPSCRDQPITGPRLLILETVAGPRVVALGADRWSWNRVAESENFRAAGGNPSDSAAYQTVEGPPVAGPAPGAR
jgi:hypothetical protein